MTDESNLEDALFGNESPVEMDDDIISSTNETDDKMFLRDVLGPEAEEAMKDQDLKSPQEKYDPKKPKEPAVYVTSAGKEIRVHKTESGKYYIKFHPGGSLPAELLGQFTHEDLARQQIRLYLAKR